MYRLIMAILTSEIGERIPCVAVFAIMMLLDYISGFLAAKRESIKYPDNSNFGLDSRKGILGIIKKVGYTLIVMVAFLCDYMISEVGDYFGISLENNVLFGWITLFWLMLNELLSITENLGRMGVPVPGYLKKVIAVLKSDVEKKGEERK